MFGIWCEVWGGVTGSREAWLRCDNARVRFADQTEAEREAERLTRDRNEPGTGAYFHYEARRLS